MKKIFSLLTAVLFVGSMMAGEVTDVLDNAFTGISGTTYTAWAGKQSNSDAVYAGQSAGGNESIQLRSNNSNSGVVTTSSGGTLKSIKITFNSNTDNARTVDVYAKNSAYSAATDLYGSNKGTKVVSFTKSNGATQTYTFTEDYEFFGFRSSSGALYIDEVEVVWETGGSAPSYNITALSNNEDYGTVSLSGKVITGAPKEGCRYADPAYTVTVGTAIVSQSGDIFTVNPSSDCTIQINFEQIPSHKIYFNTNDVADIDPVEVLEGATYTLIETPVAGLSENCTYNTFAGWTLSSSIADPNVKPATVAKVTMSTSDVTLYAVYSQTSGDAGSAGIKTFNFAEIAAAEGWENGQAYTTVEDAPVTIEAQGGGNNGKWYTSGSGSWRMYSGGTVEISVDGGSVTAVSSTPNCEFDIVAGVATFSPSARTDFTQIVVDYTVGGGATTTYSLDAQCAAEGTCVTPSINPGTGKYNAAQEVVISTSTDGATIYYTTDESDPATSATKKEYTAPLNINANVTIKAVAVKEGNANSEVAEAVFTFETATPTITGAASAIISGNYFVNEIEITLAKSGEGDIYYTIDGKNPVTEGKLYESPFTLDQTATIKAVVLKEGWTSGAIAEKEFIYFSVTNCETARIAALSVSGNNVEYNDGEVFSIRGIVTKIAFAYSETNNNMSFWFADEDAATADYTGPKSIEAYKAVPHAETTKVPVEVGDAVEVIGKLTKYGSTPEFATGCTFRYLKDGILTSVDNTEVTNKAVKFIQNGQLFIEMNGRIYNVQGQTVK